MLAFVSHLVLGLLVLMASTVVFDVVHWLLHRLMASRFGALRAIGGLHGTHHRFLDTELRIHEEEIPGNLRRHVVPEYLTQMAVILCLLPFVPWPAVAVAASVATGLFVWIYRGRGYDVNHHDWERVDAYRPMYFCLPEYHALHHVWPDAHFSSWIKTLDHVLGSGVQLAGRTAWVTGTDRPLGNALAGRLQAAGCKVVEHPDEAPPSPAELAEIDLLVLAHGADQSRPTAYVDWLEGLCTATAERRVAPEVWALSPADGAFSDFARLYCFVRRVIFRHVPIPEGDADPRLAARVVRIARRGLCSVPTTLRSALGWVPFRLAAGRRPALPV